jgi:hypothetical protein
MQLLLGHTRLESTARYFGIKVDDLKWRSKPKYEGEPAGERSLAVRERSFVGAILRSLRRRLRNSKRPLDSRQQALLRRPNTHDAASVHDEAERDAPSTPCGRRS